MKIAFLVNGIARKKSTIIAEAEQVFGANWQYGVYESKYAGHLQRMAGEAVSKGYTHIITVGGDGTLNEVCNGIIQSFAYNNRSQEQDISLRYDWQGLSAIRLGLYPAGTGNDFARTIKAKPDMHYIRRLITDNSCQTLDVCYATFAPDNRPENQQINALRGSRFCINITDVGMGGEISYNLSNHGKKKWINPKLIYQYEVFRTFLTYKKQEVKVYNERYQWSGLMTAIVMANGNYFGGGIGIAPQAVCNNNTQFGLTILGNISLSDYLLNMPTLMRSKKVKHPEIDYLNIDEITVESLSQPLPIDMDGDFIGYTPIYFRKLPQKLTFLTERHLEEKNNAK